MNKWEYQLVVRSRTFDYQKREASDWDINIKERLAALGAEGWELVSTMPRCDRTYTLDASGNRGFGFIDTDLWTFKRAI